MTDPHDFCTGMWQAQQPSSPNGNKANVELTRENNDAPHPPAWVKRSERVGDNGPTVCTMQSLVLV